MKKSVFIRFYKQQKMDKVSQDDVGGRTGTELPSPSPPKRPRTDCSVTDGRRGKSQVDFPALLTFPKTISPPSALSTLQKSEELMCAAKCGGFQDENPHEQAQDGKLNVTPVTGVTTSHCRIARAGSPDEGFITSERLPVTETHRSGSAPTGAGTPRHLTGNQPGEAQDEETPGGCSLSSGKEPDEGQVQIAAVSCSAPSEEVTRRSDCTQKGNQSDVSSEDAGTDQERDEPEAPDPTPSEEGGERLGLPGDHADYTKPWPGPEEDAGKHAKTEFRICEQESVSVCNLETKGQVNESDWREAVLRSAAECAEGSIPACDVISDGSTATENVRFEVDDFCGAKGASAAGEIIAKAPSEKADHTTETAVPAGISQEPVERDNDAGPFGVIDPAIWSETDREAGEEGCGSERAAGGGLSPSVNAHEMEAPLPVRPDVGTPSPGRSGRFDQPSRTRRDEDQDFCQAGSPVADKPHNTAINGSSCQREISGGPPESAPTPPAGDDGKQESPDAVGRRLKEQSASSCCPGGPKHPQDETCDETAETKEHGESSVTAAQRGGPQSSEAAESFSADRTESETREPENKLETVEEEREDEAGCLSDLQLVMDVAEKEGMESGGTLENCDERSTQAAQGESSERSQVINQEHDTKQEAWAFTSCPGSDALVPCQPDLSLSEIAHPGSPALNRNIRFSPLTSAFALHGRGGFAIFQKIQLSPSDDDDDDFVGLDDWARVPVSGSPPRMLETPQLQPDEAEAREDEGFLSGASSRDELPDAAAVEPPGPDSPAASSGSATPSSDVNVRSRFEMKTLFDTVLKELQLFFDISRSELAEHCSDTAEPLEGGTSERRCPSVPEEGRHRDALSDDADEEHSLEIRGADRTVGSSGEQEVPLGSHLCRETPEDPEETRTERLETQPRRTAWSQAFGFEPLLEQLSHRLLEPPRRLEPLKTCAGPRRVGLSRRARIKPLHRPHPYS